MSVSLGQYLPELAAIDPIVQDNLLVTEFEGALFPELIYREDAKRIQWKANKGDESTRTRESNLEPIEEPLKAGDEPGTQETRYEQWSVKADQYADSVEVDMAVSRTAIASTFINKMENLGKQAGQSLNRKVRSKIFCAYTGGDTVARAAGAATVTLTVESINGFTHVQDSAGKLQPVSPAYPKPIFIAGFGAAEVIAAVPDFSALPLGQGVLTLGSAATWAADAKITADDRPTIIRAGLGTAGTVDNLTTASGISLAEIRLAVATLRRNSVPRHADGYFHVHCDPMAVSQLYADNEWQRLNQSTPDNAKYKEFIVGQLLKCRFLDNNESPNVHNTNAVATGRGAATTAINIGMPMRNKNGVAIIRTLVTGANSIYEQWIDESEYASEAGYVGKVGKFNVTRNGIMVNTAGIRMVIRAPLDKLQQKVSIAWSFSGDWGMPTDFGGGMTASGFKRCIVIESGHTD